MSLTCRLRSLLAAVRPGSTGVLSVMFLVLAVVSVHALCSVHVDEPQPGAGHTHGTSAVLAVDLAGALEPAVEAEPEPLGGGTHGCGDHHTATAQCDPVLPAPLDLAVMPEPAAQRLAPAAAQQDHLALTSVVTAPAPSLHALGISRT